LVLVTVRAGHSVVTRQRAQNYGAEGAQAMRTIPGNTRMWSPSASGGLSLLEERAGVDGEGDARDAAGLVGRQEQHRVADVDGLHPRDGQRVDRLEDRGRRLPRGVRVVRLEQAPDLLVLDHDRVDQRRVDAVDPD